MKERVGNAAETYKENQANADIHVKQKVSNLLYFYNPRNGRITFYYFFFFSGNDEHAHKIRQRNSMYVST